MTRPPFTFRPLDASPDAGPADFVAAWMRRVTWTNAGLALVLGFSVLSFQQFARNLNLSRWQLDALRTYPQLAGAVVPHAMAVGVQCLAGLLGILAADEAADRGVGPWRAYATGVVAGGLVGAFAASAIGALFDVPVGYYVVGARMPTQPLAAGAFGVLQVAFVAVAYQRWRTMRAAQRRRHDAELSRADTRRRAVASRLQVMQATVEPAFLLSTLDHVLRRFETRPADAAAMLDDLIDFLRAALPPLREATSTLAQEIALCRAFVDLVRARGESDARIDVRVAPDVAAARFPPMILLPLVQAFLHDPLDGGAASGPIVLGAERGPQAIRLTIDGDAGSLRGERGRAPIDEAKRRLDALYGAAATLAVEHHWTDASRSGTRLRLELPDEANDRRHR